MATISLEERELVVLIHGFDVVLALRRTLRVPFGHIHGVRPRPREAHFDAVIREPWRGFGTYLPGRCVLGTARLADCIAFFAVSDPERTIAIDLRIGQIVSFQREAATRIVVELDNESPNAAVRRIYRAIGNKDRLPFGRTS
jgi:hypothetical protein